MERGPHGDTCLYLETFLAYLPGSPIKKLPPEAPSTEPLQRKMSHSQSPFTQLSKSPVDESSRFPKRGPHEKRCPSPEPFLHILHGPQQGSPPSRFPSQSSRSERHSTSTAPLNYISMSPVDEPTPGCPTEPP